ncbi:4Fe-4S dicluster domain-containing protein [Candidatus Fermentibacteria bacterium]|nr:4Fe-4S dicluster domain-containing protein [Candidatus Fermentibacteria bacterium]
MQRTPRLLREDRLSDFLCALPGDHCFVSVETKSGTDYAEYPTSSTALRFHRPTSPIKQFFLPPREHIAAYWGAQGLPEIVPFSLVGLRNCDLLSLRYLDHVFLGGICEDPFYRARRAAAFLVSVDCLPPQKTCFCTAVGGRPYPEGGFDINLSPVDDGYVAVAGSDAGESLLAGLPFLEDAGDHLLGQVEAARSSMVEALAPAAGSVDPDRAARTLAGTEVNRAWEPWAGKCVECGACTAVCPTCHCYYIIDTPGIDPEIQPGAYAKVRTWDSCLLAEYARMAGAGAKLTPRPRLRSRLSNRVLHKYVYSPDQYGMCGCLGCGRCDEACLGGMKIRDMVDAVGSQR